MKLTAEVWMRDFDAEPVEKMAEKEFDIDPNAPFSNLDDDKVACQELVEWLVTELARAKVEEKRSTRTRRFVYYENRDLEAEVVIR